MTANQIAKPRGVPSIVPFLNPLIRRLLRVGVPMGPNVLLTVRGRTSGEARTFPVALMEIRDRKYVFATFGEVNWVRNLRAAGEAIVRLDGDERAMTAVELTPDEAVPVMKAALGRFLASRMASQLLRRWYDLNPDSTDADYLAEARRHPVFEFRDAGPA